MFETRLSHTVTIAAMTATLVLTGCGAPTTQGAGPAPDNTVEVQSSMSDQSLDAAKAALSSGAPKSYAELKVALFGNGEIISSEMYNAPVFVDAMAVKSDPTLAKDTAAVYEAAAIEDLCLAVQMTESLRESGSKATAQDYQSAYDRLASLDPTAHMQSLANDLALEDTSFDDAARLETDGTKLCLDEIASMAKAAKVNLNTTTKR